MLRIGKRYLLLKRGAYIELQSLYGIGSRISATLCAYLGIPREYKLFHLIRSHSTIRSLNDFFGKIEFYMEFYLRRMNRSSLVLLRKLHAYRGVRYFRGLPIRGQRRRSNAKTIRKFVLHK